jgi:hypothetical protein
MKQAAIAAGILLVGLFQVTAAPRFPVAAAVPDFVLVGLTLLSLFRGPRTGLWAIPVAAVIVGFASDRAPGLLLIAYLPLLPLTNYLENAGAPLNRYVQTAIAFACTSVWARGMLTLGAVIQGGRLEPGPVVFSLLLPGVFFDLALLSLAYLGFRLLGWEPRSTSLQRAGFFRSGFFK